PSQKGEHLAPVSETVINCLVTGRWFDPPVNRMVRWWRLRAQKFLVPERKLRRSDLETHRQPRRAARRCALHRTDNPRTTTAPSRLPSRQNKRRNWKASCAVRK